MKIRVAAGHELGPADRRAWASIQLAESAFSSPYFCPQYSAVVAAARTDIFVGVIEECGRPTGYFPFQLREPRCGEPVGGPLSNYQAVIARADCCWTPAEILHGCGLEQWEFHHLLAAQQHFRPFHAQYWPSPMIDLSGGFDAYAPRVRRLAKLRRRLEREAGPLRFEAHSTDARVLRQLLGWKSAQYLRSGYADRFATPWVVEVIERIHAAAEADFAGMLSALYAGDRLVAAHMGMRSQLVWHYWYPSYDREFARYSPGLLLLIEMARNAERLGVRVIDLGKGVAPYKRRLATGAVCVAEGVASVA
jgi:CelD/BcsL family acetyltransferase involved in cellulose biosynthesis